MWERRKRLGGGANTANAKTLFSRCLLMVLNVEAEVHYVAVFDDVIFAF